jgi:hypothetical protein
MNVDELQHKLIAAARMQPPSEVVPYAFDRRILQRIKSMAAPDIWGTWAQALWRAAAPCVGVALVLAAWAMLSSSSNPSNTVPDISQQFENTVLAAATLDQGPADAPR